MAKFIVGSSGGFDSLFLPLSPLFFLKKIILLKAIAFVPPFLLV